MKLHAAFDANIKSRWPSVDMQRNNGSYHSTLSTARRLKASMPDVNLDKLTHKQAVAIVQAHLNYLVAEGLSACSVDNARRIVSRFFTGFIKSGWVNFDKNPASKAFLETPKQQSRVAPPFSDSELQTFIEHARKSTIYPQILLALGCGLRRVGTSRINLKDINLTTKTLRVCEKNRERIVPISGWVAAELEMWLLTHEWQVFNKDTLSDGVRRISKAAGLPSHCTMQGLRRTFIKKLFEAGVAPQLVARLAGNSVSVIEKAYLDIQTLDATPAVDALIFNPIIEKPVIKPASFLVRKAAQ